MKLPLRESESDPLLVELARWDGYVSSVLLAVEAVRACARYGDGYAQDARAFLESVSLIPLDESVLDEAAGLAPAQLRSLDALHLATALTIRRDLAAVATYDRQLAEAAEAVDLPVIAPT